MSRQIIILATGNAGKLKELRNLLEKAPHLEVLSSLEYLGYPPTIEETGNSFLENAVQKAMAVARLTGLPTLADDSGLEIDALDGAPGVLSARFAGANATDDENNQHLLKTLQKRTTQDRFPARFRCVIAFASPPHSSPIFFTEGICEGEVRREKRGTEGFGYDPYFWLPEERTLAELSLEEKASISHRGEAMKAAVRQLFLLFPT